MTTLRLYWDSWTIFIDPLNDLELTSGKAAYVSYEDKEKYGGSLTAK